jgi:hypothetical protein
MQVSGTAKTKYAATLQTMKPMQRGKGWNKNRREFGRGRALMEADAVGRGRNGTQ